MGIYNSYEFSIYHMVLFMTLWDMWGSYNPHLQQREIQMTPDNPVFTLATPVKLWGYNWT